MLTISNRLVLGAVIGFTLAFFFLGLQGRVSREGASGSICESSAREILGLHKRLALDEELESVQSVTDVEKALKLRAKLAQVRAGGGKVRLNVGSNRQVQEGFIPSNIGELNMLRLEDWERLLAGPEVGGADFLYSEHVWEHLTPAQVLQAAAASFVYLRPGGSYRIAVPDAYFPSEWYQLNQRAGGDWVATQHHMVMWSKDSLLPLLQLAGYEVRLLEYYDIRGQFHKVKYSEEGGRVERTVSNDPRNRGIRRKHGGWDPNWKPGTIMMTSLVIDAIKPVRCT